MNRISLIKFQAAVWFFLTLNVSVHAALPDNNPELFTGHHNMDPMRTNSAAGHADYMAELSRICTFLDSLQVKAVEDPEFGGMIEDEYRTGEERIVQTDNTQEAIYVWSRFFELTQNDQYMTNIEDAWTYCGHFPAWEEESDYYKVWNCGWGLRCTIAYHNAFERKDHDDYGESCAEYIREHAMDLPFETTPPAAGTLNVLTVAWAVWNLNAYAHFIDDSEMQSDAQAMANVVKTWIEADPENIHKATWALSGGVAAACVIDTVFGSNAAGAIIWRDTYLTDMITIYDPDEYKPKAWLLAWDSWQALAQNSLYKVTGEFRHRRTAFEQSDYVRSFDTNMDGGIPVNPASPSSEDEAWVSTYIVLMGFAQLEEPPRISFSMPETALEEGDIFKAAINLNGPGMDAAVDLYVFLEVQGMFLAYPTFEQTVFPIPLQIPLDFDLGEWLGLDGPLTMLEFQWPDTVTPVEGTWWGGLTEPGTANILGDITSLQWKGGI